MAVPTETVYGLAAPVDDPALVERVFLLKGRPFFDPLIVHVASAAMAGRYARWCPVADRLAGRFWPGPLTLVLPRTDAVPDVVVAGLPTVGVRMPDHPVPLALARDLGRGLAAPSANPFSMASPTRAGHVREAFGESDVLVLDGGPCRVGVESTVVSVGGGRVVVERPGAVTARDLADALGGRAPVRARAPGDPPSASPGQSRAHYRPAFRLVTALPGADPAEVAAALGRAGVAAPERRRLGGDPALAARGLYSLLREPPAGGSDGVLLSVGADGADPGRWEAVLDRLERASAAFVRGPADPPATPR